MHLDLRTAPMKRDEIIVREIAFHRNGVCSEPFYVIHFHWNDSDCKKVRSMMAIYFQPEDTDNNPRCAVLDIEETAKNNIAFAQGNSWRGDNFSDQLRREIRKWDSQKQMEMGTWQSQ